MIRENPEDQDSAWRQIVDNYGDRVLLDPADDPAPVALPEPPSEADSGSAEHPVEHPVEHGADPFPDVGDEDEAEGFVPEDPPPVPMPPFDRLVAWVGVFGSPAVLLVFLLLGIGVPTLLSWILIGGFVGGFCYLVLKQPGSPRDPWDDGARV